MRAYAGGDGAAFETLYARYESAVYGFCLRFLGDADAAADAFQDTFMRVVDAVDLYAPQGRFPSWLFTIARRVCTDVVRVQQRMPPAANVDPASGLPSRSNVESAIEHRDEIARYMSMIPAEQREVLLLHRYFGFAYAEIAAMTESTENAVKQKAYRALCTLREAIQ